MLFDTRTYVHRHLTVIHALRVGEGAIAVQWRCVGDSAES